MVDQNALDANSSPLLQKMLILLTDLQAFSESDVFVNHIKHALVEWDAAQKGTIDAYADFIKLLLDACAANWSGDQELLQHIKLVKTCLTPPISDYELAVLSECIEHTAELLRRSPVLDAQQLGRTLQPALKKIAVTKKSRFPQPTSKVAKKGKFYGPHDSDGSCAINVGSEAEDSEEIYSDNIDEVRHHPGEEINEEVSKLQLLRFPVDAEQYTSELQQSSDQMQSSNDGRVARQKSNTVRQRANKVSHEAKNREVGGGRPMTEKPPQQHGQSTSVTGAEDASVTASDNKAANTSNAYYLQTDEQRNDMARLYSTLVHELRSTVAETAEFGVNLELEIDVLQDVSQLQRIDERRVAALASLNKLSAGHMELAKRLETVREFLVILEAGHQNLNDELDRARKLSLTDELTGLPNRRAFLSRLDDEVSRARRYGVTLSLVLFDIDHFKQVNDRYGHSAGDAVLRVYAEKILSVFRHHDMIARYGGEEFAVLLPNTDLDGVLRALLKVKSQVPEIPCEVNGIAIPVPTFSAGMAEYRLKESPSQLIERADAALYRAKRNGRNRVEAEQPA